MRMRSFVVAVLILCALSPDLLPVGTQAKAQSKNRDGDEVVEEVLLRPLSDGRVLVHFQFTTRSSRIGRHLRRFPKPVAQILTRFDVEEFGAKLTKGRWNGDNWGPPVHGAPVGGEFWAWLGVNARNDSSSDRDTFKSEEEHVDVKWIALANAVSSLLCSSFSQISGEHTSHRPSTSFRLRSPTNDRFARRSFRYASLPGEAVCTENLTPWLKLLPCNSFGLASLLNHRKIFQSPYHSLGLLVRPVPHDERATDGGEDRVMEVVQTLTVVLDGDAARRLRDYSRFDVHQDATAIPTLMERSWSFDIQSLFGVDEPLFACPFANASRVYLQTLPGLVETPCRVDASMSARMREVVETTHGVERRVSARQAIRSIQPIEVRLPSWATFDRSRTATEENDTLRLLAMDVLGRTSSLLSYSTLAPSCSSSNSSLAHEFVLKAACVRPPELPGSVTWNPVHDRVAIHRFLTGHGEHVGGLTTTLVNRGSHLVRIDLVDLLPAFIRPHFHTLRLLLNDTPLDPEAAGDDDSGNVARLGVLCGIGEPGRVAPYYWRLRPASATPPLAPASVEMTFCLPPSAELKIMLQFEKLFRYWDQFPPDAFRGFDVGSAIVTVTDVTGDAGPCWGGSCLGLDWSPFSSAGLSSLIDEREDAPKQSPPYRVYSEALTVPLAIPDFSMPYNVFIMTCTVIAIFFGAMMSNLTRSLKLLRKTAEQE